MKITKIKKKSFISGHDVNLVCLIRFLKTDKFKYHYNFDDEINFIIFKKSNNKKLYVIYHLAFWIINMNVN